MQADMKFAIVPAITARIPRRARSDFRRGRQRADAAHLNRDRAEIRKTAQRVSRDRERVRSRAGSLILPRSMNAMNSFVTSRSPSRLPDRRAVVPRHAQQPRHRREHSPKNLLHRRRESSRPARAPSRTRRSPARSAPETRSAWPRYSAHRCRPSPAPCAAASITLTAVFSSFTSTLPAVTGVSDLRLEDLRQHDGGGRGHDHGGQQVLDLHMRESARRPPSPRPKRAPCRSP